MDELVARAEQALLAEEPRRWLELDAAVRRRYGLVVDRTVPVGSLIAACHGDGFVREAAVTELAGRDDFAALPVLALRAADWVPQVRERARDACRWYLEHAPGLAVPSLLPVAWAVRARQTGSWLAEVLEDLLRDGPPEAMNAALTVADWRSRRAAYHIVLASGRLDTERLLHAAATDPDLPIRLLCAKAAMRADGGAARLLLSSRTAAIRAEALRALGEPGPAIDALPHRSALVRATAQFILRGAGVDAAAHYRELLAAHTPPAPPLIAGLGETGADVELLRPWLAHPSSRGRAETVRALRRHGRTTRKLLLPLLTDPVSSVTRQVTLSLRREALDEQVLWPLLRQPHPPHVRMAALQLLRAQGSWTRLTADLRLVDDEEPAIRAEARNDLTTWLTHDAATAYTAPQATRADELSALLNEKVTTLGADRVRRLRFHLGLAPQAT
ncbi:hypothetical protein ACPZ19_10790 [Amycolatopsis lurida]